MGAGPDLDANDPADKERNTIRDRADGGRRSPRGAETGVDQRGPNDPRGRRYRLCKVHSLFFFPQKTSQDVIRLVSGDSKTISSAPAPWSANGFVSYNARVGGDPLPDC